MSIVEKSSERVLRLGRTIFRLRMPTAISWEPFPFYIAEFEGEILPDLQIDLLLSFGEVEEGAQELPRRFELPQGTFVRDGHRWSFFLTGTPGPARADFWPTRYVIPLLYFILNAYAVAPLHASAVEFGGRAFVFTGRSGSGKSTAMETLVERGARYLADDRLLVWSDAGGFLCTPSFDRPSPFRRWTKRRPEVDSPRRRLEAPARGTATPVGAIIFSSVRAGVPSSIDGLTAAETHARLAVCGAGEIFAGARLPPGYAITFGAGAAEVLEAIRARYA